MNVPIYYMWKILGPRITVIITTVNENGQINAAPYSFVGSISFKPPLVWVGFLKNKIRHTYENIKKTKEFVINVVSKDFADKAIECGKINEECNELEKVGLEWTKSEKVAPPKLKAAKIVLECKYVQELDINGSHNIIIGEIINAQVDSIDEKSKSDYKKMGIIYHESGPDFYELGNHFELDWKK